MLAEKVDGIALGLARITQNKQVLAGQQGDCNHLHQFFTLGNAAVHIVDHGQHFISQAHLHILAFF